MLHRLLSGSLWFACVTSVKSRRRRTLWARQNRVGPSPRPRQVLRSRRVRRSCAAMRDPGAVLAGEAPSWRAPGRGAILAGRGLGGPWGAILAGRGARSRRGGARGRGGVLAGAGRGGGPGGARAWRGPGERGSRRVLRGARGRAGVPWARAGAGPGGRAGGPGPWWACPADRADPAHLASRPT
jgi:hypothetical protein